jgi:hypothetical protein
MKVPFCVFRNVMIQDVAGDRRQRFSLVAIDQPCACVDLENPISMKLASTYFARCEAFLSHCVDIVHGSCEVKEFDVGDPDVMPPTGLDRVGCM